MVKQLKIVNLSFGLVRSHDTIFFMVRSWMKTATLLLAMWVGCAFLTIAYAENLKHSIGDITVELTNNNEVYLYHKGVSVGLLGTIEQSPNQPLYHWGTTEQIQALNNAGKLSADELSKLRAIPENNAVGPAFYTSMDPLDTREIGLNTFQSLEYQDLVVINPQKDTKILRLFSSAADWDVKKYGGWRVIHDALNAIGMQGILYNNSIHNNMNPNWIAFIDAKPLANIRVAKLEDFFAFEMAANKLRVTWRDLLFLDKQFGPLVNSPALWKFHPEAAHILKESLSAHGAQQLWASEDFRRAIFELEQKAVRNEFHPTGFTKKMIHSIRKQLADYYRQQLRSRFADELFQSSSKISYTVAVDRVVAPALGLGLDPHDLFPKIHIHGHPSPIIPAENPKMAYGQKLLSLLEMDGESKLFSLVEKGVSELPSVERWQETVKIARSLDDVHKTLSGNLENPQGMLRSAAEWSDWYEVDQHGLRELHKNPFFNITSKPHPTKPDLFLVQQEYLTAKDYKKIKKYLSKPLLSKLSKAAANNNQAGLLTQEMLQELVNYTLRSGESRLRQGQLLLAIRPFSSHNEQVVRAWVRMGRGGDV